MVLHSEALLRGLLFGFVHDTPMRTGQSDAFISELYEPNAYMDQADEKSNIAPD